MEKMNVQEAKEQLIQVLENKIDISNREVLIYGAGNTAVLYEACFKIEGITPVYFIDRNPEKHGRYFQGKKIIYIDEVDSLCSDPIVFICSAQYQNCRDIRKLLKAKGYENYTVDEYVFAKNSKKIMQIFDMLEDDVSKVTYADIILTRMGKKVQNQELVFRNPYFELNNFAKRDSSEVFVDCGAYVGDTIEQYLAVKSGVFGKIYAFEPDEINCSALRARVERLKKEWAGGDNRITVVRGGVGKKKAKLQMQTLQNTSDRLGTGLINSSENIDDGIKVYAIDDFFSEIQISFLKADIENFEESMLRGAKEVIKRDRPRIAVCIYHNASDMYRIPLLLKEINGDYKLSIRQHYCDICDTVLYAYLD